MQFVFYKMLTTFKQSKNILQMKNLILFFILILGSSTTVFSQSSVYEVSGKDSKFYIGGSIHLLREQDYPLPDEFQNAFDNSEILVLETDISNVEKPEFANKLMELLQYSNDSSLKTVLNEDVYKVLETAFAESGIPFAAMQKFKPAMVVMTLTMLELQKLGVNAEGVDKHFLSKAQSENKSLLYLESNEYQLNMFANMGSGNENEFVEHSLKDLKQKSELFEELIDAWRVGSKKLMLKEIEEYETDYPELYNSLLVDRNMNWIPLLEDYLKTKEVEFVIFGAAHLYGDDGVLNMLRDKGFNVEQASF